MHSSDSIFVAGHTGLLGSALVRRLGAGGYKNLILARHRELDLMDSVAVHRFLSLRRPKYLILAAAKVGGIVANNSYPADFISENLRIQTNVLHEAYSCGVERLLFVGSSCIYPRLASQPLHEDALLTGPLEFTNRSYAVAKIAGIEMCWAYNRQYHTRFLAAMLTNLYGPGDNYHATNSHLIPALIRKIHEAKIAGTREVILWGTGAPRREFLYSDDAADACIFLLKLSDERITALIKSIENPPVINVGWGDDQTILAIAEQVAEAVGYHPHFRFDPDKPDGTPRKLMDTTLINSLGWKPRVKLLDGLQKTYQDFCSSVSAEAVHH